MDDVYKVLLAEDLPSDAELNQKEISKYLGKCSFSLVDTEKEFIMQLGTFKPDIIISDFRMPNFDGLTALKITLEKSPLTPFIMVTGSMNEDTAVECMKAGAADYVIKEHINRLGPAVVKALEQKEIKKERYNAEIALRESEERFRSIAQSASDAILVTDEYGKILNWNKGAEKIFGYTENEILGKHFTVLVPVKIIDLYSHIWNQAGKIDASRLSNKITEMAGLRKDGSEFPFELSISNWRSLNKSFFSAIIRDISERKAAETSLKESEGKYRSLFENMLNGFAYCKMIYKDGQPDDFIYLDVNKKFEELTGLKNAVGKKVTDLIPGIKDSDPELFEIYGRVASTTRPLHFETYLDSMRMWFSISVYCPQKEYFVAVFDVITERKLAEAALKESEERYRTFINSSSDMIFLKDESSRYIVINEKLADYFGKKPKDVIGKSDSELMDVNRAEFCRITDSETLKNKSVSISETIDGPKIFEITKFPVELENGGLGIGGYIKDITARKKAEEKLAEERILLRTLIENIPDAIYIKDSEARKILANPADIKNIGKPENEIINKTDMELFPKEIAQKFYMDDLNVLKGFPVVNREEMIINPEGEEIWLLTTKVPIKNNSNNVTGLVGIGRNITGMKRAEEQIRKLYLGIEQNPAQIIITDKNGHIEYVNPKFRSVTGYTNEEIIGARLKVLNNEKEFKDKTSEAWDTILKGNVWYGELFNKRKNGERYWESILISPIKNEKDEITNFIAISEDISIRKQLDEKIIMLSRAIEQSYNSIVITDTEGIIEYVNPQFTKLTGYTVEEAVGQKTSLVKSGNTTQEQYKNLWDTIKSGQEWRGEFYNKKKSGEYFWESANISPVKNEKGKIIRFIAVKEDITERKNMINELKLAKDKAEEMNRVKSIFFANMSHELRTPFVSIIGFSEILAQVLKNPDEKEMAEAIYTSSQRLTGTLNEILNLTKLELNKTEIVLSVVDIGKIISEVYQSYLPNAQKKNLRFSIQIPAEPLFVKTDNQIVREILNNLIHNAIKFTLKGEIALTAEVNDISSAKSIIIKVKDTGIGIPEDKLGVIWEEFRQVSEGLNRSFEGSGLGLTIVRKYIDLIGGKVSVESEVKKGSVFTIELPLLKNNLDSQKLEGNKRKNIKLIEKDTQHLRLLVVEDDGLSRDYVKKVLSKYFRLSLVENAAKALNEITEHEFDAILMDINLGHGIDGVELTQKIRELPFYKNTPIIAMTAFAAESDKAEFLSKGLTHYIAKPFTSYELYKVISEALKHKIKS